MNGRYDTVLECIDWRYSAAIVGLKQYFDFSNASYPAITDYEQGQDYLAYNQDYITQERFLAFAENYFKDDMFHPAIEDCLSSSKEFSETQIKSINKNLEGNGIMKKVFGKIKFDGTNKDQILKIITENRETIIMETFRNKSNLYANYCNTNLLLTEKNPHCRLLGYSIDKDRKSKSVAYNFDKDTFVSTDRIEFDFIPFAFSNTYEALFINNNWSLKELCKANRSFSNFIKQEKEKAKEKGYNISARRLLFQAIIELSDFLDYDIEVIMKLRDDGHKYFQSVFIRKKAIKILKSLGDIQTLATSLKINENYYVDIQREALECIINDVSTDWLIELLLKEEKPRSFTVRKLIEINYKIKGVSEEKGEEVMKTKLASTRKCAQDIVKKIEKNKVKSYRQKLISAIVAEDYDRFCDIILQLSSYSDIAIPFSYDLFEDFEKNKDIAYTFVAALDNNTYGLQKNETTENISKENSNQ